MIIVKLMGGLGNQMFEYAAAKALAVRNNVELKVDLSFLNTNSKGSYTPRKYGLDIFDCEIKFASKEEVQKITKGNTNKFSRLVKRKLSFLFNYLHAVESGSNYHPEFLNYPKNTYLDGFWQSEKYFKNNKESIKADFKIKQSLPDKLKSAVSLIQNSNSVSIHVRRGDYVTLKSAGEFHGICGIDYYNAAVDIITQKHKNIELFVFSDDIDWCKKNFKFDFPFHFAEHNFESHWDMHLMSMCKHNIIANSSFSWWGAWLNQNSDKIIIAPKNWFADKTINTSDLIPAEWIRL